MRITCKFTRDFYPRSKFTAAIASGITIAIRRKYFTISISFPAYTINAAWQLHAEKDLGSLTVGKQADLLILGENPYNVDPLKLGNIPVLGTFVAGRINENLLELEDQNGIYVIKKKADQKKNNKA
jgi:predicted amidohydrolase YtcJ